MATRNGGAAPGRGRRPGTAWTWVIGGLCAVLAAVYRLVGDVTVLGECITVWPSCLWALVLLPRVLWLWLRRARGPAALSAAFVAAFVASTTETASLFRRPLARPSTEGLVLRLVTWNVAGGAPYGDLVSRRPALVFAQENGGGPALEGPWRGFHWVAGLDPAALSRFPVRALRTERVGPWTEPQVLIADLPDQRRLLMINVRLVLPALVTTAATGEWRALGPAHEERLAQFRRLAGLIERTMREQEARSVVLAGDFNSPGGTRALDPLRRLLRDAWAERGRDWGGTMTAALPLARIDQVWVSPDIEVLDAAVEPRASSDHRAVRVDIRVP